MWDLLACRACLVRGVRLESYERHNLHGAYEAVTGITLDCSSELPRYLCYECAALLRKCWRFRRRCRRAEAILQNILRLEGTTTDDDLDKLDRVKSHVASPLSVVTLEPTVIDIEEDSKCVEDLRDVKTVDKELNKLVREACHASPARSVVYTGENWEFADDTHYVELSQEDDTERPEAAEEDEQEMEQLTLLIVEADACEGEDTMEKNRSVADIARQRKVTTEEEEVTAGGKTEKRMRKKRHHFPLLRFEDYATVTTLTARQQVDALEKRRSSEKYRTAAHACDKCYRGFYTQTTYNKHALLHDPASGDYECDICRKRFKTQHSSYRHKARFHERSFACKKCDVVNTNPLEARAHELWHREVSYKCQLCERSFKSVTSYTSHVSQKHPSRFLCELCGKGFISKKGVQQHKNVSHSDEKEVTMSGPHCARCETTFATEEAYKRHLVVSAKHVGETSNGCIACGETFNTAQQLRQHQRSHAREDAASWPIECEQCKVRIGSSHEYKSHLQKVHPGVNHAHLERASCMCETCGRVFKNQSLLGYHQRKHNGVKPYECATCGKKFYGASQLAMHARMHSGDMPYQCDLCNKKFNYKANLRRHLDIHSGIKPYKCDYCGKCFTLKGDRKSHVDYVHLKKPWPKRNRATRRKMY